MDILSHEFHNGGDPVASDFQNQTLGGTEEISCAVELEDQVMEVDTNLEEQKSWHCQMCNRDIPVDELEKHFAVHPIFMYPSMKNNDVLPLAEYEDNYNEIAGLLGKLLSKFRKIPIDDESEVSTQPVDKKSTVEVYHNDAPNVNKENERVHKEKKKVHQDVESGLKKEPKVKQDVEKRPKVKYEDEKGPKLEQVVSTHEEKSKSKSNHDSTHKEKSKSKSNHDSTHKEKSKSNHDSTHKKKSKVKQDVEIIERKKSKVKEVGTTKNIDKKKSKDKHENGIAHKIKSQVKHEDGISHKKKSKVDQERDQEEESVHKKRPHHEDEDVPKKKSKVEQIDDSTKKPSFIMNNDNPFKSKKTKEIIEWMLKKMKKLKMRIVEDEHFDKIDEAMGASFNYRKHEIVERRMAICDTLAMFPAMTNYKILKKEFERLRNASFNKLGRKLQKNLTVEHQRFKMKYYVAPVDILAKAMADLQTVTNPDDMKYLQRDVEILCFAFQKTQGKFTSKLFRQRNSEHDFNVARSLVTPAIDVLGDLSSDAKKITVYCEDQMVCRVPNFYEGVMCAYAMYWIFNLEYEKGAVPIFEHFDQLIGE